MRKMNNIYLYFLLGIAAIPLGCQNQKDAPSKHPLEVEASDSKKAFLFKKDTALLGEGALWNPDLKEFWWIDIEGHQFKRLNINNKEQFADNVGQRIGTVVATKQENQALLALENGIYTFNFQTNEMQLLSNPEDSIPNIRFNDGKCDPYGRFWVGSMGLDQKADRASLYKIDPDGMAHKMLDSITISNGICWSLDHQKMYYIDTPDGNVKVYDYDGTTGAISNKKIVIDIPESLGYPDGMTIDAEGKLWVALWNGNSVIRIDPELGKVIETIEVPAHNVTSCAFVGTQLDTLMITSARVDMTEEENIQFPDAGSVFYAVPGVKGVKPFQYGE